MKSAYSVLVLLTTVFLLGMTAHEESSPSTGPKIEYETPDRPRYGMDHLFMKPTYNTSAPHELLRNTSGIVDWYGPQFEVRTNSKGLREDPFWKTPRRDVKRVLVIGDGTVFGYGVNQSERFTEKLEKLLNSKSKEKYQVLNAGIPSYGMQDYYYFVLEKDFQYNPDVIIVSFEVEDAISQKQKEEAHSAAQNKMNITGDNMEAVHTQRYDRLVGEHLSKQYSNITVNSSDLVEYGNRMEKKARSHETSLVFFLITPEKEHHVSSLQSWSHETGTRFILPPQKLREDFSSYKLLQDRLYLNEEGHNVVARYLHDRVK